MGFLVTMMGTGMSALLLAGSGLCAGLGSDSGLGLALRSGPGLGSGPQVASKPSAGSTIASQLKDVPFRATQVIVRSGSGGVVETRGRMARNSDGSTYVELIDERTKEPAEVLIFDVPHHRELVLDVRNRRYRELAAPALESREAPLDFVAEQLRTAALLKDSSTREVKDGMESTWKGLGVKRVGGLETVGSVHVRRPAAAPGEVVDGPAEVDESWISVDLGIAVLRTRHDPLKDEDTQVALTEILRSEPDAGLFQVPKGFVLDNGNAELAVPGRR